MRLITFYVTEQIIAMIFNFFYEALLMVTITLKSEPALFLATVLSVAVTTTAV